MWFQRLVGFKEESPEQVRENLKLEGSDLVSLKNGIRMKAGKLLTPTLAELRKDVPAIAQEKGKLQITQISGNVSLLHKDPDNAGAVFQAASQFNLLEMVSPYITPEVGIDQYDSDLTQGPACAIACGAGTIYRNYFVRIDDQIGQSRNKQIDSLSHIGIALKNTSEQYWKMSNGYMLPTPSGLDEINLKLNQLSEEQKDALFAQLQVGIQEDTEVTISESKHPVTQVYCSAVPINYTNFGREDWEPFARGILNATYEATFLAAIQNMADGKSNKLYLTLVGGGVFGNRLVWILDAIEKAVEKYKHCPLDVKIVSYGGKNSFIEDWLESDS